MKEELLHSAARKPQFLSTSNMSLQPQKEWHLTYGSGKNRWLLVFRFL